MKVPPTSVAATITPASVGHATLASTPTASTMQARAKAAGSPRRAAAQLHSATEGTAARPNTTQIAGSSGRIDGSPRTIATRKVAVIT